MSTPPIDSVRGGSHGIRAGYDQMEALAGTYTQEAGWMLRGSRLGPSVMADPDLVESSVLSPLSFAEAEHALIAATVGGDGLVQRAAGLAADAVLVRATVDAFAASDALARRAVEALDHALGLLVVAASPGVVLGAGLATVLAGPTVVTAWYLLGSEERAAAREALGERLGGLVLNHPELVEHLTNAGGGMVDGLVPGDAGWLNPGDGPLGSATTSDAARLLAHLFGSTTDVEVTRVGTAGPGEGPDSVRDLMDRLRATNDLDADDASMRGAVRIETVTVAGTERYVVYLPGTDDMSVVPGGGRTARDMLTNYQLLGGLDSSYSEGVTAVMREAGLAGREVMLVGHSQGGMVAAALAADPDFRSEFRVQQVLTAGSPTAQVTALPEQVSALHLENRGDAVPLLDGERTPDQPNRVSVVFDAGTTDVVANHSMDNYVHGAGAVDDSRDGSLRDALERMRAQGFLGGEVVGSSTYLISRP